jgi:pimeloyl-ACP methyl ester carboxylesterase
MYKNYYGSSINSPSTNKIIKRDNKLLDKIGLQRAYDTPEGLYQHGGNLYIAGTKSFRDVIDDLKMPFDQGAKNSQRYDDVKKYIAQHPEIKHVIGHSLGGATALQYNKDNPNKMQVITYGTPGFGVNKLIDSGLKDSAKRQDKDNIKRYRNSGDPISMWDNQAKNMDGNDFSPLDYLGGLIKNQVNPLDPLRFLDYTIKQHSYKNSDHITE